MFAALISQCAKYECRAFAALRGLLFEGSWLSRGALREVFSKIVRKVGVLVCGAATLRPRAQNAGAYGHVAVLAIRAVQDTW